SLPAVIDNDANVAAFAESRSGAGRSFESSVYVTLGSGVGAGFCTQGRIYHGAVPGELELGHVRLDEQGVTVQERCSGWAVDSIIRQAVASNASSRLAALWRHEYAEGAKQGGESRL